MSRIRPRAANSVSLFPFLAVLVCAMGALILLLIVTTRRVRSEALARADAPVEALAGSFGFDLPEDPPLPPVVAEKPDIPEPPPGQKPGFSEKTGLLAPPPPVDPDLELQQKIASLQNLRRQLRADIDEQTAALQKVTARLQQRRAEWEQMQQQRAETEGERRRLEQEIKVLEQKRNSIDGELEATAEEIRARRRYNAGRPSQYALIPFDGQTGTARRPIYIECSSSGLRFLPEGITLTSRDLEGYTLESNPFLEGTRQLIEYYRKQNRAGGDNREPYVLLLVRPSGSIAFYAARKLLSPLKAPFGYELIEEDWDLALPEVDPQATKQLQAAIDEAMTRRRKNIERLVSAPRGESSGGKVIRFNRASGTFDVVEGDPDAPDVTSFGVDPEGTESATRSSATRSTRAAGTQNGNSRQTPGGTEEARLFPKSRASGAAEPKTGGSGHPFQQPPTGTAPLSQQGGANGSFDRRIGSTPNPDRPGNNRTGSSPQSNDDQTSPPKSAADRIPPGKSRATATRNPFASLDGDDSPAKRDVLAPLSNSLRENTAAPENSVSRPFDDRDNRDWVQSPSRPGETGNRQSSDPFADSQGSGHNPISPFQQQSRQGPDTTSRSNVNSGTAPNGPSRRAGKAPTSRQAGTGAAQSAGSPSAGSSSPSSTAVHLSQKHRKRTKPRRRDDSTRRQRWGEAAFGAAIGFERELVIRVTNNHIAVGRHFIFNVDPAGSDSNQLGDRLYDGIDSEARRWGRPPESFYWVPRIRLRVAPGGDRHVDPLKKALHQVGLGTQIEYVDAAPEISEKKKPGFSEKAGLLRSNHP